VNLIVEIARVAKINPRGMEMLTGYFTTRQGRKVVIEFASREDAQRRLDALDADEERTQEVAPTDTGDVRFSYNAEARVIRKLLAS
jgi:hypothetical protein